MDFEINREFLAKIRKTDNKNQAKAHIITGDIVTGEALESGSEQPNEVEHQ